MVLNSIEYRRRRGATGTIQLTPLFFLAKIIGGKNLL